MEPTMWSHPNRIKFMSASQRQIQALEQQLAVYQQMQREYNVFLNYLVVKYGTDGVYTLDQVDLVKMEFLPIRTEISNDRLTMIITRVKPNHEDNAAKIIIP
jgi:hypothetical protein